MSTLFDLDEQRPKTVLITLFIDDVGKIFASVRIMSYQKLGLIIVALLATLPRSSSIDPKVLKGLIEIKSFLGNFHIICDFSYKYEDDKTSLDTFSKYHHRVFYALDPTIRPQGHLSFAGEAIQWSLQWRAICERERERSLSYL